MSERILHCDATLTDRYQTTVPDAVRKALHLRKRDKIQYTVLSDGTVTLTKAQPVGSDPALEPFLAFLEKDLIANPARIHPVTESHVKRIDDLVGGVDFDLNTSLSESDD